MARQAHEPTALSRSTVATMAGYGIPQEAIARSIGISDATLRKYYEEEIGTAATKANSRVADSLFKQAVGAPAEYDENGKRVRAEQTRVTTAAIFWLKCRAGWKETSVHELTGANGSPFTALGIDAGALSRMTENELDALEKAIGRLQWGDGDGEGGEAATASASDYAATINPQS
jgi:hypothetical protein